jgi:hypothetical protein
MAPWLMKSKGFGSLWQTYLERATSVHPENKHFRLELSVLSSQHSN